MRKRMLVIAVLLMCLLCGCMDVESYLQPPRSQGQQRAVQEALEATLSERNANETYILKYPSGGSISSAFLMLDEQGVLTSPHDAVAAVAFYATGVNERTHLCLLRRQNDAWSVVADVQGEATDLNQVTLSDLDGDGVSELLVGWNLYSNSFQLSVYALDDALTKTADAGRYTRYFVGDLTEDGGDEVVLLHSSGTVTASLCRWQDAGMTVLGTAELPQSVRGFENMLLGKLTNGENGLYVDVLLDSGAYSTVLLCWDGARLRTPLHSGGVARIGERSPYIATKDVDGNGVPEIPVSVRALDEDVGRSQLLVEWYTWDVGADAVVRQCGSVANVADGYCVELEEAWFSAVSGRYDENTRTLWLEHIDQNGETKPFLAIQNTADGQAAIEGYTFETLPGTLPLRIWYETAAPYRLTKEKISYMLVAL